MNAAGRVHILLLQVTFFRFANIFLMLKFICNESQVTDSVLIERRLLQSHLWNLNLKKIFTNKKIKKEKNWSSAQPTPISTSLLGDLIAIKCGALWHPGDWHPSDSHLNNILINWDSHIRRQSTPPCPYCKLLKGPKWELWELRHICVCSSTDG